jgi:hypothetical protein
MGRRMTRPSPVQDRLTKPELHALCDRLAAGDLGALVACIEFFVVESSGMWHNRARAMMARRFKHIALAPVQARRLCEAIAERLRSGHFSEQFRDQLRLLRHLDVEAATELAHECADSSAPHVRRYATWLSAQLRSPHSG